MQGAHGQAGATEGGVPSQPAQLPRRTTVTRGLLQVDEEPSGKQRKCSDVREFHHLWDQAVSDGAIVDCPATRVIKNLALEQFRQ